MFDSPFDFFAIVIAIIAFIVARKAINQVAALRAQLESMQRLAAAVAAESPVHPPLTPAQAAEQTPLPSALRPPPIPDMETTSPATAHRRHFRNTVPVSRRESVPAGWCGSAA